MLLLHSVGRHKTIKLASQHQINSCSHSQNARSFFFGISVFEHYIGMHSEHDSGWNPLWLVSLQLKFHIVTIILGWASISGTMLVGSRKTGGAGLTGEYVHVSFSNSLCLLVLFTIAQMMFVVGTFFSFIGPLLLGFVLDHYGPRVCSLLSIFLVALGCFLFSISDASNLRLFIPATSLIAFGGPGVQTAIIHLSNLFPLWKATATACITGCFQLSFVIFLIFDYVWENYQVPYQKLFLGYCFVCLTNGVVALLLWPDSPYHFEEEVEIYEKEAHISHEEAEQLFVPVGKIRQPSVFVHHDQLPMMDTTQQARNDNLPAPSLFKVLKEAPLIEQVSCMDRY